MDLPATVPQGAPVWRPTVVLPPGAGDGGRDPYDRWAHRRGEPRAFILVWTTYLFAGTLLTLLSVAPAGYVTGDIYRPAAQALLAVLAAGVTLLWPMFRLSQEMPPQGGLVPTLQDCCITQFPAQAVVWPQVFLTGWPVSVVGAAAACLTAWGLLVGSLLALALSPRDPRVPVTARLAWMGVFLALALAGAAPAMFAGPGPLLPDQPAESFRPLWMLSPLTAVFEVTRDRPWSGRPAMVVPAHWVAILWTAAASVPIWGVAAARSRGRRPGNGLH